VEANKEYSKLSVKYQSTFFCSYTGALTNFNAFFLTVHMGWFFEGALFPRELFLLDYRQNKVFLLKNISLFHH